MWFKRKQKALVVSQQRPLARTPPKAPRPLTPCVLDEDTPLVQLSRNPDSALKLQDFFRGILVLGSSGSGKSSMSARVLCETMLKAGFGLLWFCAKETEVEDALAAARAAGRAHDVIVFDPDGEDGFNFLEYEMQRAPAAADIMVQNVVSLLLEILDMASRGSTLSEAGGGDAFWEKSARMLLTHAIALLYAETGRVKLAEVVDLIESAPSSKQEMKDPQWLATSFFAKVFDPFFKSGGGSVHPMEPGDADRTVKFWMEAFVRFPEKTRGNFVATLSADLAPLLQGRMRRLFSEKTTIIPEQTFDGGIIILNYPTKVWGISGILAQGLFGRCFELAAERRPKTKTARPLGIIKDEASQFISASTAAFQSTARSSRVASLYLAQSIPQFYQAVGGKHPEHTVDAILSNLSTHIYHSSNCMTTARFASEVVGKETFWRATHGENSGWSESESDGYNEGMNSGGSSTFGGGGGELTHSSSWSWGDSKGRSRSVTSGRSGGRSTSHSEQRDVMLEPSYFARHLRTGGAQNWTCRGLMPLL